MNKQELHIRITAIEDKLDETLTGLDRGPVKDAMRLVVPIIKDQIAILRELVEKVAD